MPRKNEAPAMLPPKPRAEKIDKAERELPKIIIEEAAPKLKGSATSKSRTLERARKEDEEATHKARSVREAINALYDEKVLPTPVEQFEKSFETPPTPPKQKRKKVVTPKEFEESFQIPEPVPGDALKRTLKAAEKSFPLKRRPEVVAKNTVDTATAFFNEQAKKRDQIESTKNLLGQEKAARIWDRAYELTNKKNGDDSTAYVFELAQIYKDATPEAIAALNRKYNIPESYNPIAEGGAMKLTKTHTIGETRGRAQGMEQAGRTAGRATTSAEISLPKKPQREKAYEVVAPTPEPKPISPNDVASWRNQLLKKNEDLHAEIERLQAEEVPTMYVKEKIKETSQKIRETEAELAKSARYDGKSEETLAELSKKLEKLSRQIKQTYGKTPEQLHEAGGFSLRKAKIHNWLRSVSGQGSLLTEWENLNAEYRKSADVIESYKNKQNLVAAEAEPFILKSTKETIARQRDEIEERWISGKNPPSASDYLTAQNAVNGLIENIETEHAGTKIDSRTEELIASLRDTAAKYEALADNLIQSKKQRKTPPPLPRRRASTSAQQPPSVAA